MHSLAIASAHLAHIDDDWANLVRTIGTCTFEAKPQKSPYEALIRAVAYQQLSTKAGDAILGKFIQTFGEFPDATTLRDAEFDKLRAVGFSGRKIETLKRIAEGTLNGLVPTQSAALQMENEELIKRLVSIKGIGKWTVEMLLIFTLTRIDVLPVDDWGIRQGYRRLKKLEITPKPRQMAEIGQAWSPYRSIASWYLWRVPR